MAEKEKDSGFKVSDRRLFTADGELRTEAAAEETPAPPVAPVVATTAVADAAPVPESDIPVPPTATEQQEQHDAYNKSARDLDTQVELSGHSAKDLEISFERFMASLYMTAMLQLGLMHEQ